MTERARTTFPSFPLTLLMPRGSPLGVTKRGVTAVAVKSASRTPSRVITAPTAALNLTTAAASANDNLVYHTKGGVAVTPLGETAPSAVFPGNGAGTAEPPSSPLATAPPEPVTLGGSEGSDSSPTSMEATITGSSPPRGSTTATVGPTSEEAWLNTTQMFGIIVPRENGDGYDHLNISRKKIRSFLLALQPHANTLTSRLPEEAVATLRYTIEVINNLHSVAATYKEILDDVAHVFPVGVVAEPGTVAAFFSGCRATPDGFSGPPGCNPKCAGSLWQLPTPSGSPSVCGDSVMVYRDGVFNLLVEQPSDHAYVFVGHDHSGFSRLNVSDLLNMNLKTVTVVHGNYQEGRFDNSYDRVEERVPVHNLPVHDSPQPLIAAEPVSDEFSIDPTMGAAPAEVVVSNSTSSTAVVVLVIIFVLAAMVALIVARRRTGVRSNSLV